MKHLPYRVCVSNVNSLHILVLACCVLNSGAFAQVGHVVDPLSSRITKSDSVVEFAKAIHEDGVLPNAVSANVLDQTILIYPQYVAMLTRTYTTPPKDVDELLLRLDAMADIFQYFASYESVAGWVFADTAKVFALAEEQYWIACRFDDRDVVKRLKVVNQQFRIDPKELTALAKGPDRADQQKGKVGREAVSNWSREKYISEISDAADSIWKSHEYANFTEVLPGLTGGLLLVYPDLLVRGDEAVLAYIVLLNDSRLMTVAEGTLEFIERGGDLKKVDMHDVRYFRTVMPSQDTLDLAYPIIGIRRFNSVMMSNWLNVDCSHNKLNHQANGKASREVPPVLKLLVKEDKGVIVDK